MAPRLSLIGLLTVPFRRDAALSCETNFFRPAEGFAPALGLMARQAFSDAFAHLYDPVPFKDF
jgi:hypothetical protein